MKKGLQITIQILFLTLLVFVVISQKMQLWMGVFLIGVLLSAFFGRLYCGYICPINTLTKPIAYIKKKLNIKHSKYPKFLESRIVRYLFLLVFIGLFLFSIITGKKLPVLLIFIGIGVALSIFFHEELWHRFLCPYGIILSFSSKKAKKTMKIDPVKCNNCGVCQRVCPAKAVTKNEGQHEIIANECLVCLECERNCRQDAISYSN